MSPSSFSSPSFRAWKSGALAAALLATGLHAGAASLTEGFTTVVPAGWTMINNSDNAAAAALATTQSGFFQGASAVFSAQAGATTSYAAASFNSTIESGTISAWLITPTLTFNNGDLLTFYTRTLALSAFPDALEVRFSNVGGTSVGSTSSDVGTFTTTLLSINPGLATGGYPEAWTQYSVSITGLSGPTSGAIAFRYFVTNGGPFGDNSNYIGIDTVNITAVPEPAAYLMLALGLGLVAVRRNKGA
jgi:hypothetical protein